jgi:hypothetical protein
VLGDCKQVTIPPCTMAVVIPRSSLFSLISNMMAGFPCVFSLPQVLTISEGLFFNSDWMNEWMSKVTAGRGSFWRIIFERKRKAVLCCSDRGVLHIKNAP